MKEVISLQPILFVPSGLHSFSERIIIIQKSRKLMYVGNEMTNTEIVSILKKLNDDYIIGKNIVNVKFALKERLKQYSKDEIIAIGKFCKSNADSMHKINFKYFLELLREAYSELSSDSESTNKLCTTITSHENDNEYNRMNSDSDSDSKVIETTMNQCTTITSHENDIECKPYDFKPMVDELPSRWNRDHYRQKESIGIPLEWMDLYKTSKHPRIPNNLITSVKQAMNTTEWKELGIFQTKRGKESSYRSKFIDIVSILSTKIPTITITSHENDIECNDDSDSDNDSDNEDSNTIENTEYQCTTITSHENDIDGYKALSIEKILHEDYSVYEGMAEKTIKVLLTPYTINGKKYQILFRKPNPHYVEGNRKAKWLYAFDSFFATAKCDYTFTHEKFERKFVITQNKKFDSMGEYRILNKEFSNWLLLTRPTKAFFNQTVHSMIGTKLKGCEVVSEEIRPKEKTKKGNAGFIYIEDLIDNANKYAYEECKPTAFFASSYFRHYTPYSMSNCVIRSLMRYNGNPLDQVDVASMHPVILLQEYMKRFMKYETERETIMKIITAPNPRNILLELCHEVGINITSDEIKVENLAYYNMRQKDACHMKLHKMYEQKLSGFCEWLAEMKTKSVAGHKGYWNHKFVSRWLEWKESTIMDRVLEKCWDNGIFALGIHDGIDVEQGKGELVASWIKESMHDAGYICNVTVNK